MNKRLPRTEYIMKAVEEIEKQAALMLKMRWGLEDGKPRQIAYLAQLFSLSQIRVSEELKRLETHVLQRARELQDQEVNDPDHP